MNSIMIVIYWVWLGGAMIIDLIEQVFRMFAGLPTRNGLAPSGLPEETGGDIATLIINNPGVRQIFINLTAFAAIMLIFFTILQIIREHYKDQHGGNPYVLVFRMVKAMVLFMFIQAACIVGLQLSSVVLRALEGAVGGGDTGISGRIFVAMAAAANRVVIGDEPDIDGGRNRFYMALIAEETERAWIWTDPIDMVFGHGNANVSDDGDTDDDAVHPFHAEGEFWGTFGTADNHPELAWNHRDRTTGAGSNAYPVHVFRFDITDYEGSMGDLARGSAMRRINAGGWNGVRWVWIANRNGTYRRPTGGSLVGDRIGSTNYNQFHSVNLMDEWRHHSSYVLEDRVRNTASGWVGTYYYIGFRSTNQYGRPASSYLRRHGGSQRAYFFLTPNGNKRYEGSMGTTMLNYYNEEVVPRGEYKEYKRDPQAVLNGEVPDPDGDYARWINDLMSRRAPIGGEVHEHLHYYNSAANWAFFTGHTYYGPMRFTNTRAVSALYNMFYFNWIIGFGGLAIALGVYNSFLFGMIQRIAELGVLYMFSPVTLAFFPFDDGSMFNSAFVKPFYKKVISVYAPVLSLNLFFVILGAFDVIVWPGGYMMRTLTRAIVSIALLSMLPKVRTTIQTMLGADPMEEKKMFGKGGVMQEARQKAWNAIKRPGEMMQTLKNVARQQMTRHQDRVQARQAKRDDAVANALQAKKDGVGKYANMSEEQIKKKMGGRGLKSFANRQALKANLKRDALGKAATDRTGKDQTGRVKGFLSRQNQKRHDRRGNKDNEMDKAINAGEKGNFDRINGSKALREQFWAAHGKAMGITDPEKLEKHIKDNMGKRIGEKEFMAARGYGIRDANDKKIKDTKQGLKTRLEAETDKWRDRVAPENQDAILKANGLTSNLDKDGISGVAERRRVFDALGIDAKMEGGKLRKLTDDEKAKYAELKADDWLKSKDGQAWADKTKPTPADIKKLDKIGRQNRADARRFSSLYNSGEFQRLAKSGALNKKDHADFFDGDKLKEKDELEKAFHNSLNKKETEDAARKTFGAHKVSSSRVVTGLRKGLRGLGTAAHCAVSPWKMVDTFQGGVTSLIGKNLPFLSTAAMALFDPDNGLVSQTGLGKFMDGFSYYQSFKSFEKWETAQAERAKYHGFAKGRTTRFLNSASAGVAETAKLNEQLAMAKADGALETTEAGTKKNVLVKEKAGEESSIEFTKDLIGALKDKNLGKALLSALTDGLDKVGAVGSDEYRKALAKRSNDFMASSDKDIKELDWVKGFGGLDSYAKDLTLITRLRDETLRDDETIKDKQVKHTKTVTDYTTLKHLADNGSGGYRTIDEFEKSQEKDRARIRENEMRNARVLGISGAANEAIGQLQQDLFGEQSLFIKVKRVYDMGERPSNLQIDGQTIDISSPAAFQAFQDATYKKYEDFVASKVDMKGVAFRDYGEKKAERLDGLQAGMMAEEKVKIYQELMSRTSKETHQIFHDKAFADLMENSNWMGIHDQLMAASRGEANNFDKGKLAAIGNKAELAEFAVMFRDMMGNADGELRGTGFGVANNIIAKAFRMAFVDQIDAALQATRGMIDNMQVSAQQNRNALQRKLATFGKDEGWLDANEIMKLGEGDLTPEQLEAYKERAIQSLKDYRKKGTMTETEYTARMDQLTSVFAYEMDDRRYRRETNEMTWAQRRWKQMDFQARALYGRQGDAMQAQSGSLIFGDGHSF